MSLHVLKKVSLFSGLRETELKEILKLTSPKKYRKNNTIILEDSTAGDMFYIITKGKVKVTREDEDGKEVILSMLGRDDFFGELSLLDGLARSANVITVNETNVLAMKGKDFLKLVREKSRVSSNLLKVLCARVRKLDSFMKRVSLMNTVGKVASTLLGLTESEKQKRGRTAEIEKIPSLENIAKIAGTSKSSVSRALQNLEKSGIIKRKGRKVTIKNYSEFKSLYC